MLRVGSGFPGACLWSSPKLYDHGFTAGALFFPDGYSYSLPVLPHGGCGPPALIVGCNVLRHILGSLLGDRAISKRRERGFLPFVFDCFTGGPAPLEGGKGVATMFTQIYYTIMQYIMIPQDMGVKMGVEIPQLCFLQGAEYGYKLFVRGLICPKSNYWSIYGIFFAPPHPNSIINCMIIKSQLLTFHSQR